ncbi:MAG: hypothetical protein E7A81_06860 [Clostridiales bacterium]|nr:hypothetical protein [Clostridiales bacterium]MDU1042720.1 hypothetical protein [Clostridiales bacterium]MDU3490451.1 hypothetical protein [Clostridiales bacterium]
MDLLAKRYASPFLMLDEFIRLGQLHEFIKEVSDIVAEEKKESIQWEFFLHKVFDKSFNEYIAELKNEEREDKGISREVIKDIINESEKILEVKR